MMTETGRSAAPAAVALYGGPEKSAARDRITLTRIEQERADMATQTSASKEHEGTSGYGPGPRRTG